MPDVALFVPCYVDQLFPRVAWATVALLERHGCRVTFLPDQTCCGQLHLNAGDPGRARALARRFLDVFSGADHVVAPSASCVATVRRHYAALLGEAAEAEALAGRTRELCEFLVGELGVREAPGRLDARVALHPSCHGLRELRLGAASELGAAAGSAVDPARALLVSLAGVVLVAPERADECCGFGGAFAVGEADVSCAMGRDRVRAFAEARAEVVTATDVSCLAHLDGVVRREGAPLRVLHVAELLAEAAEAAAA